MSSKAQRSLFDYSVSKRSGSSAKPDVDRKENHESFHNLSSKVDRFNAPRTVNQGKIYYLLQVDYDGDKGKAVCKLYDEETKTILLYEDSTGHKPYFLVDVEPEKVNRLSVIKDRSFDHIELVTKLDPYTKKQTRLTKVVSKDPLAVRRMRDHFPKAYEAHIKYFNNYIYDLGLIPGMPHVVREGTLQVVIPEIQEEEKAELLKLFDKEDEMIKETVLSWYPLFESTVPEVKRAALDIEVYTVFRGRIPDPEKAEWPIISVALVGNDGRKEVFVLNREDVEEGKAQIPQGTQVLRFNNEREMLMRLFETMASYPVILTFNGDDFDMPYLYYRALKLGIEEGDIPIDLSSDYAKVRHGIHVDLYRFFFNKAVRNYAFEGRYSEYNLDAVATAILGLAKVKIDNIVSNLSITNLVEYNLRDSEITLRLTTENSDLTWKLIVLFSRISKMGIEELTRTEISTWIKNLYYWEHRRRNWLIPLKEEIGSRTSSMKTKAVIKGKGYKGAVVIDPPQGIYFGITVLDFASLYPSIIKNWNLSYETVDVQECSNLEEIKDETGETLHAVCKDRPGITAVITGLLRDFRVKIYKRKAKSSTGQQKILYDVVQRAMKVFINATYGVFGAETFPLYAPAVAESVTALGRYVITETARKAEGMGLKVLYGDTDSLFLLSPPKDRLEGLIAWVKENFNLDFEVDKVYKYVAFSGLKKNYFGVYLDGKVDVKGMLAKKRNTPEFLKGAFSEIKDILAQISSEKDIESVKLLVTEKIKGIYNALKGKEYNLDELAFRVMLSKFTKSYDKNTPQHVKAAIQLEAHNIQVQPRDIISFVKVKGKEGVKPVQLAKLSEIDVEKYLESVRSTFEQILSAFNISWDEIESVSRIESFFKS
jgi:DNA polymerase I